MAFQGEHGIQRWGESEEKGTNLEVHLLKRSIEQVEIIGQVDCDLELIDIVPLIGTLVRVD